MSPLRLLAPLLLAAAAVVWTSVCMRRRQLVPPRFLDGLALQGSTISTDAWKGVMRRALAGTVLGLTLYLGVMAPLAFVGQGQVEALPDLQVPQLFTLHLLFAITLLAWYALGFLPHRGAGTSFSLQFGLRARSVLRELALGSVAGLVIWLVVIVLLLLVWALVALFGGPESLPQQPPGMVSWLIGLPVLVRLVVSLSAGFFEEVFFRGFLQPRVGIATSTLFFSMAHLSYDQPFLLIGVTILSLLFAGLVRWRQSVWAAVAAHSVFDTIQLLIVIPLASRLIGDELPPAVLRGLF